MSKDKICILINSRGHANDLIAVMMSASKIAVRPDLIEFGIRVDDDDQETIDAVKRLEKDLAVNLFTGPRPVSHGLEHNFMANQIKADYYTILNDDTFPLTPEWDLHLHVGRLKGSVKDDAFFGCWTQTLAPTADYPIITRQWFEAAGNKIFPEYFPFWFDDMWLNSLALMVYGHRVHRLPINLSVKKTKVQRMRETAFWWNFFTTLEFQRIVEAQEICNNLGMKVNIMQDREPVLKAIRDATQRKADEAAWVEGLIGDKSEPDPGYLIAKRNAEDVLAAIKEGFSQAAE